MKTEVQIYEGACLVEYPTARLCPYDRDVQLEVPSQYYNLEGLKGLIKFLKDIKRQLKAAQEGR